MMETDEIRLKMGHFVVKSLIVLGLAGSMATSGESADLKPAEKKQSGPPMKTASSAGDDLNWCTINKIISPAKNYSRQYLERCVKQASENIKANPLDAVAYVIRGLAYKNLEQFNFARADLEKAQHIFPQIANAYMYRVIGECFAEEGLYAQAVSSFTRAIKLKPEEDICYLRRAQTYAKLKNYASALKDADRVVAFHPNEAWTYEFRARVNDNAGRYQNVVADCTAALSKLNPEAPKDYAQRAKAYEKLGNKKLSELDKRRSSELSTGAIEDLLGGDGKSRP